LLAEYSRDEIKEGEIGGACACVGERRNVYRALVGKPEGNILVVRPGNRWECNIKMNLK
jgi:hypothetical protein